MIKAKSKKLTTIFETKMNDINTSDVRVDVHSLNLTSTEILDV